MNLENGLRILENIGFPKNPTKISFCGQTSPTQFSPPPPLRLEIATSAALRACAARALPPPSLKKRRELFGGLFFGGDLLPRPSPSSRNLPSRCSRLGKTHGLGHFEWEIPSLGHFEWEIPSRARAALCADFWSYIRVAQGENRKKKKSVKSLSLRTECAALRKKLKFQKK